MRARGRGRERMPEVRVNVCVEVSFRECQAAVSADSSVSGFLMSLKGPGL